jgi:type IV pilus assembly protein PilM
MLIKKYLAIDVGNSKTKIVHGGIEKDKIVVENYFITDTPSGVIEDGKIKNLDELVEFLKASIKKSKIRNRHLILSITGTGVITRDIQLPKSSNEELEKMIEFEAQQYFPVELENYIMDFKVLDEIETSEGIFNRILLVAVPKTQIDEYMNVHKKLKKEIVAIDIPANNICKLIFGRGAVDKGYENNGLPGEFAVLDFGAKTTGVYIFSAGKIMFSRILLNGSNDIDDMIANKLNVEFEKAEEIKITAGKLIGDDESVNSKGNATRISEIMKPVINNIMSDINRFIEFYNSRSTGNKLEKIYLCGGGSKLKGLDMYLKNYFNMPVEYLEPQKYVVYKGKINVEEIDNDFVFLVNALGSLVRF